MPIAAEALTHNHVDGGWPLWLVLTISAILWILYALQVRHQRRKE
jgi:hypothetical protein